MKDERTHLKIKIKNLADEARTIRAEENKSSGMDKWHLQHHRKTVVRDAARRSQIAYQIIRGREYDSCSLQHSGGRYKDWKEIARMVKKYGSAETVETLPKLEAQFKLGLSGDNQNEQNARYYVA